MSIIRIAGFAGENRALHPYLLPDGVGVSSINQKPGRGDLRPWNAPLTVATVPAGRKTIYRMGRDVPQDDDYWLSWPTVVHAVRGPNATDTAERTYFSGHGTPKWTDTTKALASTPYPTSAMELGIPAPETPVTLSATGGTASTEGERAYTYTYVSDIGEESAPQASPVFITCKTDDEVTLSGLAPAPDGNYGINRVRIYRTQTDSSGVGEFYFLREIASTLTTTTDDNRTLGEVMPTTTWLQPPADLSFLTGLWNGMMAGISGRSVRFCEAYVPYAWPMAYEVLPTATTPVALATFGQTLVMLTDGNPSYITGGTPDAMDEQPIEWSQACIAPQSAVGMGHGVAWAAPDGLAYVGQGGPRLLTQGILTRDDWQALNPATIMGAMYEGRYFGFFNGGAQAFMLDPANAGGMYLLDFGADAVYLDDMQDALYVLDGVSVKKWDAGAALTTTFKSKVFRMPKPTAGFACAEVTADAYPVSFRLYADGVLKHTQTVTSGAPFRLPGGYYADNFQIEVATTGAVQGLVVAHSMAELAST